MKHRHGLTLIEVLVVVCIIAILYIFVDAGFWRGRDRVATSYITKEIQARLLGQPPTLEQPLVAKNGVGSQVVGALVVELNSVRFSYVLRDGIQETTCGHLIVIRDLNGTIVAYQQLEGDKIHTTGCLLRQLRRVYGDWGQVRLQLGLPQEGK